MRKNGIGKSYIIGADNIHAIWYGYDMKKEMIVHISLLENVVFVIGKDNKNNIIPLTIA